METAQTLTKTDKPRIYVACLAAYNNGILHGAWIDADRDAWAIWAGIRDMLARSPIPGAEEHAIHDYEGFEGVSIAEYADIERVAEVAAFIAEHGALGAELLNYYGNDLADARAALMDRYLGCHHSLADYMQELTEDSLTISEALRFYIDWKAMARDAEMSGDVLCIELDGQVHIFSAV
jgi:antirestriction protein